MHSLSEQHFDQGFDDSIISTIILSYEDNDNISALFSEKLETWEDKREYGVLNKIGSALERCLHSSSSLFKLVLIRVHAAFGRSHHA